MDNHRVDGPAGPPKPAGRHDAAAWGSAITIALASAGLLLVASFPTRTMGASLSTRLKWEQRRQEAVAAARAADRPDAADPAAPR